MILLTPVLLLVLALSGFFTKVVDDFTQTCPEFFVNPSKIRSPPTVFAGDNYKQICQIRENTYEFATLYDTDNKIPVYSAYKFGGYKGSKRNTWYIEPQLEDPNGDKRMRPQNISVQYNHQAVNADYKNSSIYSRGHLAPASHSRSPSSANATFTLTNVAPQDLDFNRKWKKIEEKVAKTLEKKCNGNFSFIVTGVVPGTGLIKKRVTVPSHLWTAYCCLDDDLQVKASHGFLGENTNKRQVLNMSVSDLDVKLTGLYGKGTFKVFGGNCDETIIKTTTAPTTANTPTTPNLPSTTTIPIHRLCQRHLRYLRHFYRLNKDMHTVPNMRLRQPCRLLEKCLPHHVHHKCQAHQLHVPYSLRMLCPLSQKCQLLRIPNYAEEGIFISKKKGIDILNLNPYAEEGPVVMRDYFLAHQDMPRRPRLFKNPPKSSHIVIS